MDKRVLMIMRMRMANHWELVAGVGKYAVEHGLRWQLRILEDQTALAAALSEWKPDGVILHQLEEASSYEQELVNQDPFCSGGILWSYRRRTVCCVDPESHAELPHLCTHDNEGIGELAGRYFLERGFRHFAYVTPYPTDDKGPISKRTRLEGFRRALKGNGATLDIFDDPELLGLFYVPGNAAGLPRLAAWLAERPQPLAVFACFDQVAYSAVEACRLSNLRCPEDVAVLGVNNNTPLCEGSRPTISSIELDSLDKGYRAAKMLRTLFSNEAPNPAHELIPVDRVIERESSSVTGVTDPAISRALRYLEANLQEPLQITDLVRVSGISRSLLDRRFRETLGRSPLQEVHRQRVARVCTLLVSTDKTMAQIAEESGFSDQFQMYKTFKKLICITPGRYRKLHGN